MTKWTPGPYVCGESFSHGAAVYSKGASGVQISFFGLSTTVGKSGTYRIDADECLANAQLFSAAPDLYEATDWIDSIQTWAPIDAVKDEQTFQVKLTGTQIRKLIDARKKAVGLP